MKDLSLDHFLELETDYGWKIKDADLMGGHHIVYKIPMDDHSVIALPESFKRKATANICLIRGLIIKTSRPFRRVRATKTFQWSNKDEQMVVKWVTVEGTKHVPTDIRAGSGILYSSYNVGRIPVKGLSEPLVVVRDVDIMAAFDMADAKSVVLPDKALNCAKTR